MEWRSVGCVVEELLHGLRDAVGGFMEWWLHFMDWLLQFRGLFWWLLHVQFTDWQPIPRSEIVPWTVSWTGCVQFSRCVSHLRVPALSCAGAPSVS
eukprot:1639110-Rhodomonas_salina.1